MSSKGCLSGRGRMAQVPSAVYNLWLFNVNFPAKPLPGFMYKSKQEKSTMRFFKRKT